MHAAQLYCLATALLLALTPAAAFTPTKQQVPIRHGRVARAGSSHLNTGYNASLAAERIQRAQVPHGGIVKKRGHVARAQVSPPVCMNNAAPTGPTNHPCQSGGQGGDGCMNGFALIDGSGMTLQGGRTFDQNSEINFEVIDCTQWTGYGSFQVPDPNWKRTTLNAKFNEGTAFQQFYGKTFYPWTGPSRNGVIPAAGYCVIWMQYSGFNPHYGQGAQLPACSTQCCKSAARRRDL